MKLGRVLLPGAVLAAVGGVWELSVRLLAIPPYLLPPPSRVAARCADMLPDLLYQSGITLGTSIAGFALALAASAALSVLFILRPALERLILPYVVALKVLPIIALAPFLIIWFGNGAGSKIVAAALACFFPVLINILRGLHETDAELLDLMRSFPTSDWEILTKLRLPSAVPFLFTGLKVGSTLAVMGTIVAEFVGANRGLGHLILTHSYYLKTDAMFAAMFALMACGVAFFACVAWIERVFFARYIQPSSKNP